MLYKHALKPYLETYLENMQLCIYPKPCHLCFAAGTGVTTNSCHPGVVTTNLGRHMCFPLWKKILFAPLVLLVFKTPFYGAQTQIYLSVSPDVENVSGFYFALASP